MSVYRDKNSPCYTYDFRMNDQRFKGSTNRTSEREAKLEERRIKDEARHAFDAGASQSGAAMTIGFAIERYKTECSDKVSVANACDNYGPDVKEFFGAQKRLAEITDNEIAQFITWKQKRPRWGDDKYGARSPASVNRSTWQFLRPIFNRASDIWGVYLPKIPKWKLHRKKEADPTIRVLSADEFIKVFRNIDSEYAEIVKFALVSGLRLESSLLKWSRVNLAAGTYSYIGKGNKECQKSFIPEVNQIISGRIGHNDDWVFTYKTKRWKPGIPVGTRRPITVSGLQTYWRRLREEIGIEDFRWHDLRHTYATAVLAETGDIALAQELLDHSSPEVTRRHYARIPTARLQRGAAAAGAAIAALYSQVPQVPQLLDQRAANPMPDSDGKNAAI